MEPDDLDPDDALGLLDEEDGLGPTELTEDGLWNLFDKTLSADEQGWQMNITMRVYRKVKH